MSDDTANTISQNIDTFTGCVNDKFGDPVAARQSERRHKPLCKILRICLRR